MKSRERVKENPFKAFKYIVRWMLSGAGVGFVVGASIDQYFWVGTGSVIGTVIGINRYLKDERNRHI